MHSKNFDDLTGKVYGYYTVLGLAPPKIAPSGKKRTMWRCQCVCNKIVDVYAGHLKKRPNISCGCMKKTTLEDLTGQIFNNLIIESRAESTPKGNGKKRTMWNCRCLLCGKTFVTSASQIKGNIKTSCGCDEHQKRSKAKLNDYTGKTVGRLYVESRAKDKIKPNGAHVTTWNCICACGNKCIKSGEYLKNSPNPSCGCWKSEETSKRKSIDITDKIYGFLYVLFRIGTKRTSGGNPKPLYMCFCSNCESITEATYDELVNGTKRSCGCVRSFGEKEIRKELTKRNIKFKTSYWFKDLYSTKNHPLYFDFAILDRNDKLLCLIEYQGVQHYKEVDKNGTFGKLQREVTDKMKKEYCEAHNITLYEIRYDENIYEVLNNILAIYVNSVPSSKEKV